MAGHDDEDGDGGNGYNDGADVNQRDRGVAGRDDDEDDGGDGGDDGADVNQ